jgi:hypothetical protein
VRDEQVHAAGMATHTLLESNDFDHAADERWNAWVAKGKAHDRLIHGRIIFAAAVLACILAGGAIVALVFG